MRYALLIIILCLPFVAGKDYCCLGPYACEGFDTYKQAVDYCSSMGPSFSSYDCSHRHLKNFCRATCQVNHSLYVVYDIRDCNTLDGEYDFNPISNLRLTTSVGGRLIADTLPVPDVMVKVDQFMAVTDLSGKFRVRLPYQGEFTLNITDLRGEYKDKTYTITAESEYTNVGQIILDKKPFTNKNILSNEDDNDISRYRYLPMNIYDFVFSALSG